MPIPTPFHARTAELCSSMRWKDWAGTFAVRSYGPCHEREYQAIRHAAGLLDVSALYKYEVSGADAGALLARIMVKDVRKLAVGRVTYLCWCDDDGKVLDDGTVTRLAADRYRVTAAEPSYAWLLQNARGYRVDVADRSEELAALAIQGPTSRDVLCAAGAGAAADLGFFRQAAASVAGVEVEITRTGYTGDLGYELWVPAKDAVAVYDAVLEAGAPFRIVPAGLDAMDVTRIEAGFIMNGVDYFSANHCLIEGRKSSPYEIGLGWTVELDREPFIGQRALAAERQAGSAWATVGLVYDWDDFEALFAAHGLPPAVPAEAWRDPRPIYDASGKRQVGYATSGTWSPILKQLIAIATVERRWRDPGTELRIEVTAEYHRRSVRCRVVKPPFFDPERKRS